MPDDRSTFLSNDRREFHIYPKTTISIEGVALFDRRTALPWHGPLTMLTRQITNTGTGLRLGNNIASVAEEERLWMAKTA